MTSNRLRLILVTVLTLASGLVDAQVLPEPTGQPGRYTVATSVPGFVYHVSADEGYNAMDGWGIQLMLRGKNASMADAWQFWEENILVSQRLVGVSMMFDETKQDVSYSDEAMIRAAMEAFAEVHKAYKTLPGRGSLVVTLNNSVADTFFKQMRRQSLRSMANHIALYNVSLDQPLKAEPGLTITFIMNSNGWNRRGNFAPTGPVAAGNLGQWIEQRRASPDAELMTGSNKRFAINKEDIAESAKGFQRSDLAFCGFVQPAAFTDPQVSRAATAANQSLGRALKLIENLESRDNLKPEAGAELTYLKQVIDARAAITVEVAKKTATQDALLTAYYLPHWQKRLEGHPAATELQSLEPDKAKVKHAAKVRAALGRVLQDVAKIPEKDKAAKAQAASLLQQIVEAAEEGSLSHRSASGVAEALLTD